MLSKLLSIEPLKETLNEKETQWNCTYVGTITHLFSSCIDLYRHTLHLQLHTNDYCTVKTSNNISRCSFPMLERVQ